MRTFLLVCVSLICVQILAQDKTLTLKHKATGSVYEVDPQKAIKCKLSNGHTRRGYIQNLTEDAIVVNGDSIAFNDIEILSSRHTRKNASAKTGGIVLTSLGGLLTAGGVILTAGSVQEDDEGTVVGGVTLGAATIVVGIGTTYFGIRALKRKRFNMTDWDFAVQNY
jgi:hypothetical protein